MNTELVILQQLTLIVNMKSLLSYHKDKNILKTSPIWHIFRIVKVKVINLLLLIQKKKEHHILWSADTHPCFFRNITKRLRLKMRLLWHLNLSELRKKKAFAKKWQKCSFAFMFFWSIFKMKTLKRHVLQYFAKLVDFFKSKQNSGKTRRNSVSFTLKFADVILNEFKLKLNKKNSDVSSYSQLSLYFFRRGIQFACKTRFVFGAV